MSIEDIKATMERKEAEIQKPSGIFAPSEFKQEIYSYMDDPLADMGKALQWENVKLSLKAEMYLLTGIPSMGKSTWMDSVIIDSALIHNYKWAIFSPEAYPVKKYLSKLLWVSIGKNLHGRFTHNPPTKEEVSKALARLDSAVVVLNPEEEDKSIEGLLERGEWLIKNAGVNAFLFDPYNEFSATRPSNITETEYVSKFLGKVRSFVNTHEVMVWIVAHPTKLRKEDIEYPDGSKEFDYAIPTAYDIAGSANFYNKPDNIIAVHRNRNREKNPNSIVQIKVWKARNGGDCQEGEYLLSYNYKTNNFTDYIPAY